MHRRILVDDRKLAILITMLSRRLIEATK